MEPKEILESQLKIMSNGFAFIGVYTKEGKLTITKSEATQVEETPKEEFEKVQ